MKIKKLKTLSSIDEFNQRSQQVAFTVLASKTERYNFVGKMLIKFNYMTILKKIKKLSFATGKK